MRPQDIEDRLRADVENALDNLRAARQRGESVLLHQDRLQEALTAFEPLLGRRMPQREHREAERVERRA